MAKRALDPNHPHTIACAARLKLDALELPYPGGDACTRDVTLGLAAIYQLVTSSFENFDEYELLALLWLRMWIEAGGEMLPKELKS